ncbi:MAG: ferrous iron transport protein B [Thermodesulfobacteriota bacterium]|nr:ferrous iron transport protein B [Thermodesulfobacteriota bacterium]
MKQKITIALSGNPNSGKTTAFNAITGARQHIANYPGVTVEKKFGKINHKGYEIEVVDLPGTYSLTAYSLEEIVARDFLVNERPDVVVDIVDASNLDRNLYLAVQFKELGVPLIIALNMMDVAESRGIKINQKTLSTLLDVPVVPTVARSEKGINELLDMVIEVVLQGKEWKPEIFSYGIDIDQSLLEIEEVIKKGNLFNKKYSPKWLALKCLENDRQIIELIKGNPLITKDIDRICQRIFKHIMDTLEEEPEGIIADHRYGYIAGITKKSVKRKVESRLNVSDKIDKVLTNRIIGPLIMMTVLYGIYEFTFKVSKTPLGWIELFFEWLKGMISLFIPEGNLHSLIVSGIIDGVGGVLGFVPLIMFMFLAIAILEDSGYMARVAYMLDRVLRWFGLHGNSVMAILISGGIAGGCAVPGVMATRTLRDPKERIATLLVVPFMNCGAKLPVFAMLIGAFFIENQARMMFIFTLLSWSFALFAAKILRSTVLRGPKTPFVMELPPYRAPTIKGLLIHTWERTWQYIKKAGTIILGISVILWAMMSFPGLSKEQAEMYEDHRTRLKKSFLSRPEVKELIKNEHGGLIALDELFEEYSTAFLNNDRESVKALSKNPFFPIVERVLSKVTYEGGSEEESSALLKVSEAYADLRAEIAYIEVNEQQASLKGTIAGRIGLGLEGISRAIGFDYRTNIALVGGFVAKEVVVAALGTAYSLKEVNSEKSGSLSEKLRSDPNWNPLVAFTLILFIMLYVPCFVTVISIKRETSWKWAGFSIVFNMIVAYMVSLMVYQIGSTFGIGT